MRREKCQNLDLKEERKTIIGTSLWFYKGEGREASYSPRLSGTGDEEKYRHKSSLSGLRAGRKRQPTKFWPSFDFATNCS